MAVLKIKCGKARFLMPPELRIRQFQSPFIFLIQISLCNTILFHHFTGCSAPGAGICQCLSPFIGYGASELGH